MPTTKKHYHLKNMGGSKKYYYPPENLKNIIVPQDTPTHLKNMGILLDQNIIPPKKYYRV